MKCYICVSSWQTKILNVTQGIELMPKCKTEIVYITITSILFAKVLSICITNHLQLQHIIRDKGCMSSYQPKLTTSSRKWNYINLFS